MIHFPNPLHSDENGIVFIGGDPTPENLVNAYSQGIFPWPHKEYPLLWFSPLERGILTFKNFRIPKSTVKALKKMNFQMTVDKCFDDVIDGCMAKKRSDDGGTWITPAMVQGYKALHRQGNAHSIECWQDDKLVGGLYGVYVNGAFSGESMFYLVSGASKACLIFTVEVLKRMGHEWFDIQMVTDVLEQFGGRYVPRKEYLKLLKETQKKKIAWSV